MKYLTDFRKTVETGMDPRLSIAKKDAQLTSINKMNQWFQWHMTHLIIHRVPPPPPSDLLPEHSTSVCTSLETENAFCTSIFPLSIT